jgi:E3 ubiquitin-protein ligase RNF115/126
MLGHDDDDDDESMPSLEDFNPHIHPLHNHNPWRDSPEGDAPAISNFRIHHTGPGSIAITSTFVRTIPSPNGHENAHFNPLMNNFAAMLNSIVGGAGRANQQRRENQEQSQNRDQGPTPGEQPSQNSGDQTASGAPEGNAQGATPGGPRFPYDPTARLFPRDPNRPGPHVEPVDDLNKYVITVPNVAGQ